MSRLSQAVRSGGPKRWRRPRAQSGELKAQWGKVDGDGPGLCYAWGLGISKSDSHLLHGALTGKQYSIVRGAFGLSFSEELTVRGYDLTTLRFTVRKLDVGKPSGKQERRARGEALGRPE